jgi:hypothetical protein
MDAESRFRSIQLRAYEIFCARNPASGTAEEDWRKAESQIEQEKNGDPGNFGPARLNDKSNWGCLTTHQGEDLENPS